MASTKWSVKARQAAIRWPPSKRRKVMSSVYAKGPTLYVRYKMRDPALFKRAHEYIRQYY